MRIRQRKSLDTPIHLAPGDSIQLSYRERGVFRDRTTVVARDTVDRPIDVDEAIVFDLEQHELDELGLKDAIGGLFGSRGRGQRADETPFGYLS